MNAHLINHSIIDIKCYIVVLSEADKLEPNVTHNGHLVRTMTEAFKVADMNNATLLQGGKPVSRKAL